MGSFQEKSFIWKFQENVWKLLEIPGKLPVETFSNLKSWKLPINNGDADKQSEKIVLDGYYDHGESIQRLMAIA